MAKNLGASIISEDDKRKSEERYQSVQPAWEKAKRILAARPSIRQKNSIDPGIWQFRQRQEEAERLKKQLENLAHELGIEP